MKILAYCTFFPEPDNHGDAIRRGMILKALRGVDDLTIIAIRRASTTPENEAEFRKQFPQARIFVFDPDFSASTSFVQRGMRVVAGVRKMVPAWIMSQHSDVAVRNLHDMAGEHDVVLLIGEPAGLAADGLRHPNVIWDKSNVLTASLRRAIRGPRSGSGRWHARANLPWARFFERRVIESCSEVWVTSAEEEHRLRDEFADLRLVRVIPSAVKKAQQRVNLDESGPFVWLSSLNYTDNWIGLIGLVRSIQKDGAGKLRIRVIGGGASHAQREELERFSFVEFYGYVEDLSTAFNGARAGIVPVWTGAGVKLKTLTLIQHGLPIIATACALEGIPLDVAYAVPASNAEFVESMANYDDTRSSSIAENALRVIGTQLSSEVFEKRIASAVHSGLNS